MAVLENVTATGDTGATEVPPVAPVERPTCDIVQSDVLEFLKGRPDKSVDLVLGSPPYDSKARRYGTGRNLRGQDWVDWMFEVFRESLRVSTGLVAYVVDGSTKDYRWSCTPALLIADLHRAGYHLRKPVCYVRHGIPGSGGKDWLKNNWEWVICASQPGILPWSDNTACGHEPVYKRSGPFSNRRANGVRNRRAYTPPERANPGNVINCKVGGNQMGSKLAHENEAPFPELLAEFFVRSFCPPGGRVLDPFTGSGTTPAVSIRHGRNFVGCDLRPGQVELALRRVAGESTLPATSTVRVPRQRTVPSFAQQTGPTVHLSPFGDSEITLLDLTGDGESPLDPLFVTDAEYD
jgi:DNA modification methylase